MRAWTVARPGQLGSGPLRHLTRPDPEPGPGEVRVRACGVCRADLHLAEGDLVPRRPATVPGHEIVGVVDARGPDALDRVSGLAVRHAALRQFLVDERLRCRRHTREFGEDAADVTDWVGPG